MAAPRPTQTYRQGSSNGPAPRRPVASPSKGTNSVDFSPCWSPLSPLMPIHTVRHSSYWYCPPRPPGLQSDLLPQPSTPWDGCMTPCVQGMVAIGVASLFFHSQPTYPPPISPYPPPTNPPVHFIPCTPDILYALVGAPCPVVRRLRLAGRPHYSVAISLCFRK